ncbi:MAG TPA: ATP synthase F1 subunit gamma [Armatimonadota bacterium]|nr:ATP synthase F1 subunit gamma [Armatimonadota bacterium]
MATMRDIRRRIRTVRSIQQITKALKMVAAARLQRAQSRATAARPYADEMLAVISHMVSVEGAEEIQHPLLEVREPINLGLVVITSDRGMAGSYNGSVLRKAMEIMRDYDKDHIKLVTVGKKGRAFFSKRRFEIAADYPMPSSEVHFAEAQEVSMRIREMFQSRQVDAVQIIYTRFYSAIRTRVTDLQLLPAMAPEGKPAESQAEYIFEPPPVDLLGHLLPRYVDTQVFRAMLESLASEHGARMTAMSSATDNAGEMIDRLTLDFNRARQAAITKELAEIVGGAEALK